MTKPVDVEEIRARHKSTTYIDWVKEFDPEFQPQSLNNAAQCHADRAALLTLVDTQAAELKRLTDALNTAPHPATLELCGSKAEALDEYQEWYEAALKEQDNE